MLGNYLSRYKFHYHLKDQHNYHLYSSKMELGERCYINYDLEDLICID